MEHRQTFCVGEIMPAQENNCTLYHTTKWLHTCLEMERYSTVGRDHGSQFDRLVQLMMPRPSHMGNHAVPLSSRSRDQMCPLVFSLVSSWYHIGHLAIGSC